MSKQAKEHNQEAFDGHTMAAKGSPCKACLGLGRVYCCQSLEYTLSMRDEKLDVSVLPCFPGTNMEMNFCCFCGRKLDRPVALG